MSQSVFLFIGKLTAARACEAGNVEDVVRLGDLLDLRHADLLVIKGTWVGYNDASPIAAQYTLRRTQGAGLAGDGLFLRVAIQSRRACASR